MKTLHDQYTREEIRIHNLNTAYKELSIKPKQ